MCHLRRDSKFINGKKKSLGLSLEALDWEGTVSELRGKENVVSQSQENKWLQKKKKRREIAHFWKVKKGKNWEIANSFKGNVWSWQE